MAVVHDLPTWPTYVENFIWLHVWFDVYFMFSLPFFFTLMFPWSLYTLLGRVPQLQSSSKLRDIVFLGIIGFYLAAFGGRGNVEFSESAVEAKSSHPLFDKIAALPKDVMIAGWPVGQLRKVEYV